MLFPTIEFILFTLLTLAFWCNCNTLTEKNRMLILSIFNILFYANLNLYLPIYLLGWVIILQISARSWKTGAILFGILELIFWKSVDASLISFDWKTPLGLSFFTFQGLTYIFGLLKLPASKPSLHIDAPWDTIKLFAFVGFFPTLLSGPILRASAWNNLSPASFDMKRLNKSLSLILIGFVYKICLSSILHDYSVEAFANPKDTDSMTLLIGMYAYTFEIYSDFAGYSLMAMGVAYMYGFDVPFNFDKPYMTTNIREFWTRWHISFSSWLRDYLYFSLGGSKVNKWKHYLNLMIVMTACGLWHGFASNYIIWGLLQGFAIVTTHVLGKHLNIPKYIAWIINFHFICISWIIFRSTDAEAAYTYINSMFNGLYTIQIDVTNLFVPLIAIVVLFIQQYEIKLLNILEYITSNISSIFLTASMWSMLFILVLILSPAGMPPFIYFSY